MPSPLPTPYDCRFGSGAISCGNAYPNQVLHLNASAMAAGSGGSVGRLGPNFDADQRSREVAVFALEVPLLQGCVLVLLAKRAKSRS